MTQNLFSNIKTAIKFITQQVKSPFKKEIYFPTPLLFSQNVCRLFLFALPSGAM